MDSGGGARQILIHTSTPPQTRLINMAQHAGAAPLPPTSEGDSEPSALEREPPLHIQRAPTSSRQSTASTIGLEPILEETVYKSYIACKY